MKKDFEKRKALWFRKGKEHGITFPEEFICELEEDYEAEAYIDDEDETIGNLEWAIDKKMHEFNMLRDASYFSERKKPEVEVRRNQYPRCFEKRLYIVEFVMERRPHNKRANTFQDYWWGSRFNWKLVCADWNKKNPYDPMSPAVLKVRYYRAIAEENIQREYYKRKYHHEIAGVLGYKIDDSLEILSKSLYNLSALPSDLSDSAIASLPKELIHTIEAWREAHPSTAEWQQIKTAGGSKALIALNKVWYQGGTLTPDEEILLKQLHDKYLFGQTDFTIWLEQTLKQVFEKSVDGKQAKLSSAQSNPTQSAPEGQAKARKGGTK